MIDEMLLYQFGATAKVYQKDELIFEEGTVPHFYHQIKSGSIKLNNFKEDGKEFIQNIFSEGNSFGESLLFLNFHYPMNAVALERTEVLILPKSAFFELLEKHPIISLKMNQAMAERLYYKYTMLLSLSCLEPHIRLLHLLNYLKRFHKANSKYSFEVPFTRQQIADLTGLCVETVIRTSKKLAQTKVIKIQKRKIYY
jgi:CRP/FNR family cyclic AMP-dependent transcriptional regulator